jgi:hypothetical protein
VPLRIPWHPDIYAVRVGPHTVHVSRAWVEFLAHEGRSALVRAIVDEVRQQHPGQADDLAAEGLSVRIVDRRQGEALEPRLYARWLDDRGRPGPQSPSDGDVGR